MKEIKQIYLEGDSPTLRETWFLCFCHILAIL